MLGKTNREIAHLPPRPGAPIGHNHFDFDLVLARQPDLVVSFSPAILAERATDIYRYIFSYTLLDYRLALLTNDAFGVHYLPHMVPLPELRARNALYVRDTSPELARLSAWRYPQVTD
jgi:hypothetical protein